MGEGLSGLFPSCPRGVRKAGGGRGWKLPFAHNGRAVPQPKLVNPRGKSPLKADAFQNGYFSPPLAGSLRRLFFNLHPENPAGLLEVKLMKVWKVH